MNINKDALKYRITSARKARGWTQKDLAQAYGSTKATIQRYETGKSVPNIGKIFSLALVLGVSADYLLGASDDISSDNNLVIGDKAFLEKEVPLYGSIAAGMSLEMIETDDSHGIPICVHEKYPRAFLLKVSGKSMDKILPDGCYALIDPCKTIDHNDEPYALCISNLNAIIRRVRMRAKEIELLPDSTDPTYRPETYVYNSDTTDISIIGRVVWFCVPYDWRF